MRSSIYLFFVIVFINSCSSYSSPKDYAKNENVLKNVSFSKKIDENEFILDKSKNDYRIYIRKNDYMESDSDFFEMQYLLINYDNSEVIYISTTPKHYNRASRENFFDKDGHQKSFNSFRNEVKCIPKNSESCNDSLDKILTEKIVHINSYYFNKFFFGKLEGDSIVFQNKNFHTTWRFNVEDNYIKFNEIIVKRCKDFRKHKNAKHLLEDQFFYEDIINPEISSTISFNFIELNNFKSFVYNDKGDNNIDQVAQSIYTVFDDNKFHHVEVRYKNKKEEYRRARIPYYKFKY